MSTRIIMRNDGRATAEGETEVFGTTGAQTVTVLDGATVTFRSGFNSGGDTIRLNGRASDFTVSISGSNVTFRSVVDNITVVIPIGTAANTITFDNGDSRSLSLVNGVPILGAQTIPNSGPAAPVTAGPGTYTITGAASANEGGVLTYTVTRTDTASAETLLFSVDGSTNGGTIAPATQGADFSPASGAVVFAAGQATATFTVAVASDNAVEGLEGISVRVLSNGAVVASTNATIIDGNAQGQAAPLSAGVDNIVGTAGNDTVTGRLSEFSSLDTVTGGAGIDTLVLTGVLPADNQPQPDAVLDAAFERTSGIERLVLTGGTLAQSVNAVLGTLAADAGLQEVVAGGTGGQAQVIDIQAFDAALTVTGSGNAETVNVNLATAGAKTLNLGNGDDLVNVTPVSAVAGSVQVNFTSAAVGNGADDNVTIVSANGNVIVNDESTVIQATGNASVFNVVGLAADGTVDLTNQNRGNFGRIELGTGAGDTFETDQAESVSVYFNAGAGNDTFDVVAQAGERHFVVGGAGNDSLTIVNDASNSRVVALMGEGTDTVIVNSNAGAVDVNLGDGDDSIRFNGAFTPNLSGNTTLDDFVNGGAGRDTLLASSASLTSANNTVAGARQTVSGIELVTVTDTLANNFITSRVQAGIDTVTLAAGTNGSRITFDAGLASTLNLGAAAGGLINVASAGTGTSDQVTIANTAQAVGGVAVNVFGGQDISTTGVETLIINTTGAGSARTQTIGAISATDATLETVNFIGDDSVTTGVISAINVNASGLTGSARITATTVADDGEGTVNTFIGSANGDAVTLGSGLQDLDLGAGNDTLTITALDDLVNGTSDLAGGAGTDTIRTTVEIAATLSNSNPFNANQSGFEVLSFSARQADAGTDVIRVDNLNVNRVVSLGTALSGPAAAIGPVTIVDGIAPVAAQTERVTVNLLDGLPSGETFVFSAGGVTRTITANTPATVSVQRFSVDGIEDSVAGAETMTFTIAGRTITFSAQDTFFGIFETNNADLTAAEVAAAFASGVNGSEDGVTWTITGTLDPAFSVAANGGELVFTAATAGLKSQLPVSGFATNDGANNVTPAFLPGTSTLGSNIVVNGGFPLTAAQLATVLATGVAPGGINVIDSGPFPFNPGVVTGGSTVTFQRPAAGDFGPDASVTVTAGVPPVVTTDPQGVTPVTGQAETATFTFVALEAGQSITFAGRTVTATANNVSAEAVAEAFATAPGATTGTINGIDIAGAIAAGYAPSRVGATVTLTGPQAPQTDLTATSATREGTIVLQNMSSGDTLEIAGASTGTHEVRIIDAGLNTNDVLNLVLTGDVGGRTYGTVTAANVETVNLNLNGLVTTNNTAAVVETINLNIAQTESLVVTGNNGAIITHNATGLTLFDASGVVGNAGDLRSGLGVTFQSLTTTGSVTIRGGVGNDDLFGNGANDTFDLTRGGSDLVGFSGETRADNGLDVVNGFTGGSGANGDILDLNGGVDVVGVDSNDGAAGIIFNATASNTVGDLVITGDNDSAWFVTGGQALINPANVKSQITGATAQNGEILVADGASGYVLHAASGSSNTFNVYRVFDADELVNGVVDARVELLGTVNMINTFANLTLDNVDVGFTAAASTLTAADVAAASAPVGGSMMGMLDNLGSFQIV